MLPDLKDLYNPNLSQARPLQHLEQDYLLNLDNQIKSFLTSSLYKLYISELEDSVAEALAFEKVADLDDPLQLTRFKDLRSIRREQERALTYFTYLGEQTQNEIRERKEEHEYKSAQQKA
jgi:hypothetical protein